MLTFLIVCDGGQTVLMSQFFAPTSLAITFETEGQGSFTSDELEQVAIRNEIGEVIGLRLPTKSVIVANHQVCVCAQGIGILRLIWV
jgi:hypothetical protein